MLAAPEISIEQVRHVLEGADRHLKNVNPSAGQMEYSKAAVMALLLIAQELDQIGDLLALQAGVKNRDEITVT